jgi:hypothetical protein
MATGRVGREKAARFDPLTGLAPLGLEDCCIMALHRADERFRRRQLTPEEREEVQESLERLRERLGLPASRGQERE